MDSEYENLYYLICSIIFISLGLFLSIISYIIFAIFGLINTSLHEQNELCSNSHLWIYSLVSLILLINVKNIIGDIIKEKADNNYLIIKLSLLIFMIGWGGYEFYGIDCINKLSDTMLYKSSFAYWFCNIILLVLFFIIFNFRNNTNVVENNDYHKMDSII